MSQPLSDDDFWKVAEEAIVHGLKFKATMIQRRLVVAKVTCPRCSARINLRLAGPKNHLRMACEGKCGMNFME